MLYDSRGESKRSKKKAADHHCLSTHREEGRKGEREKGGRRGREKTETEIEERSEIRK